MTEKELEKRRESRVYFTIDAQNHAGCWENLWSRELDYKHGWMAGYAFFQWLVSLRYNPHCKYTELRLSVEDCDGEKTVFNKFIGAD